MSIRNCLIGCAVGDALGFVVEGYDAAICREYVDKVIKLGLLPVMTRLPQFQFGQYSDDTQLTREFICHLAQTGGRIDANLYATRIAMLFAGRFPDIVGYGRQTRNAAIKIIRGYGYNRTGCKKGQGNGGVMRSAIVGAAMAAAGGASANAKQQVIETATHLSAITHASPSCKNAAAVVALTAYYFAQSPRVTGAIRQNELFDYLQIDTQTKLPEVELVRELITTTSTHEQAKARIIEHAVEKNRERSWPSCISYGVWQTTMWALWCVAKYPDDYIAAISEAICVGGDVDTTAAIVGAIVAIRVGEASIPIAYRESLHDIYKWTYRDLCDLADRV